LDALAHTGVVTTNWTCDAPDTIDPDWSATPLQGAHGARAWRAVALAVLGVAVLLTLSACGTADAVHNRRVFSFHGARLIIDDPSSDLRLTPWNGSGIEVQRWLGGTAAKPSHSSWNLYGDTLHLDIDCSGLVFRCESRFQVALPAGVSVIVHSGPGNDTASGLSSFVAIEGGSGQVHLTNTSGPPRISTDSGNVTASGIRSPHVQAASDEGSVTIGFAAAPQRVQVRSMVGNATVKVPTVGDHYRVSVSTGSGSTRSKVPSDRRATRSVHVTSGNGTAEVLSAQ
jgi:DUF4097 and DUF4098 domain-containing protein YvlB